MAKGKIIFSGLMAAISGSLGAFGALGFCCTLTGAAILSFLGIASLGGFIALYNHWLLLAALVFILSAIYFYYRFKYNSACALRQKQNKYDKKN